MRNKQTKMVVKNRIQRSKNVRVWCHAVGDRVERVYDIVVGEGRRMVRWGIINLGYDVFFGGFF